MYIVGLAVHTTGSESDESAQTYSVDQQELKKNHLWLVEVSTSSQTHNSYIHWITSTVLKVNHRPIGCSSVIIAGGISSPWQNSRGINCAATSSAKLNLPNTSLLYSLISTGQHPDSIQNSSHLLPHCLWYVVVLQLLHASHCLFFLIFLLFSLLFFLCVCVCVFSSFFFIF